MVALFTTAFHFSFPWPAQVYAVINKYPNPLAPHVITMDVVDRSVLPDGTVRSERIIGIRQDSPRWIRRILGAPDITYAREVSFIVPASVASPSTPDLSPSLTLLEPPKLLMASTNLSLSTLLQCRETISYIPHPWPFLPAPTRRQFAPQLSVRDERMNAEDGGELPDEDDDDGNEPYPSAKDTDHPLSHPTMPPTTLFSQSALIFSTGVIAADHYPPYGVAPDCTVKPETFPPGATYPQRAAGKKVEEFSKSRFEQNASGGRAAMEWAAGKLWRDIETPDGGE
ncbi:hypothetical protein JCM10049v2_001441 [Rhodotorula toruloides]